MNKILNILLAVSLFLMLTCHNRLANKASTCVALDQILKKDSMQFFSLTVFRENYKDLTIHATIAPDSSAATVSYIIETDDSLVIVDVLYYKPNTTDLRKYANSLGKKINRIIVSHNHPDHWLGLDEFKDIPVFTTKNTITFINDKGRKIIDNLEEKSPAKAPNQLVVPTHIIRNGIEIVDGIELKFVIDSTSNTNDNVLIELPTHKLLIAQDLIFNQSHQYVDLDISKSWLIELQKIYYSKNINKIYCGHAGFNNLYSSSKDDLKIYINYIETVSEYLESCSNFEEFKNKILLQYPKYSNVPFLDFMSHSFKKNQIPEK